jgi:hypothetical protein
MQQPGRKRAAGTKGVVQMGRANKPAIDRTAELQARAAQELRGRAAKDPVLSGLLTGLHRRFRLWRLCAEQGCRRAHDCRGDALACGARRWPVARSLLRQIVKARRRGPAVERIAGRNLRHWSEEGGVLGQTQTVFISWRPPLDEEF